MDMDAVDIDTIYAASIEHIEVYINGFALLQFLVPCWKAAGLMHITQFHLYTVNACVNTSPVTISTLLRIALNSKTSPLNTSHAGNVHLPQGCQVCIKNYSNGQSKIVQK